MQQQQHDSDAIRQTFRRIVRYATLLVALASLAHVAVLVHAGSPAWHLPALLFACCLPLRLMLGLDRSFPVFLAGTLLLFTALVAVQSRLALSFGHEPGFHLLLLALLPAVATSGRIGIPSKLILAAGLLLLALGLDVSSAGVQAGAALAPGTAKWLRLLNLGVTGFAVTATVLHYFTLVARQQAELKVMASTDPLTGLYNRRQVQMLAAQMRAQCQREGWQVCVALCDLDRFKSINDTHGHDAGDAVLKHVANLLAAGKRTADCLGRWGGEEFVLVLPHCDGAGALGLARRLCQKLASTPLAVANRPIDVTMTIGLAVVSPEESMEQALSRADAALYAGKLAGRNTAVLG